MGGEKFVLLLLALQLMGSPPHGRGKEAVAPFPLPAAGITPAWAGKSNCCFTFLALWEDHPRMGGEKWARVA